MCIVHVLVFVTLVQDTLKQNNVILSVKLTFVRRHCCWSLCEDQGF